MMSQFFLGGIHLEKLGNVMDHNMLMVVDCLFLFEYFVGWESIVAIIIVSPKCSVRLQTVSHKHKIFLTFFSKYFQQSNTPPRRSQQRVAVQYMEGAFGDFIP